MGLPGRFHLAGGDLLGHPVGRLELDLEVAGALVEGEGLGLGGMGDDVLLPVHVGPGPGQLDLQWRRPGQVETDVWRTDDVGGRRGEGSGGHHRGVGGRDLGVLRSDLGRTLGGAVPEDPLASLPTEGRPRSLEAEALGAAQPTLGLEVLLAGDAGGGEDPDVVQQGDRRAGDLAAPPTALLPGPVLQTFPPLPAEPGVSLLTLQHTDGARYGGPGRTVEVSELRGLQGGTARADTLGLVLRVHHQSVRTDAVKPARVVVTALLTDGRLQTALVDILADVLVVPGELEEALPAAALEGPGRVGADLTAGLGLLALVNIPALAALRSVAGPALTGLPRPAGLTLTDGQTGLGLTPQFSTDSTDSRARVRGVAWPVILCHKEPNGHISLSKPLFRGL